MQSVREDSVCRLRLPVLAAAAPGETYGFNMQYEALVVRVDVR